MANHKSAKKRIRISARREKVNTMQESKVKTVYKKALSSATKEEAEKIYKEAIAIIDRNAAKGNLHKNNAARKKANITKHLNSLTEAKK